MEYYKIYHNPRCRKSRAGLQHLQEKGLPFRLREYLKDPLTPDEFRLLLQKMNRKPFELIRTQETLFKQQYKGRQFTDDKWITILTENPSLIQRPIVEFRHRAVLAQPPEEIDNLIQ